MSPVPGHTVRDLVAWMFGRRRRYRVTGRSMLPTLCDGDYVLVVPRASAPGCPSPGDVVVARHPHQSDLVVIKRVQRVDDRGVFLVGDSPDGTTDSRDYGPVSVGAVWGRVACVLT